MLNRGANGPEHAPAVLDPARDGSMTKEGDKRPNGFEAQQVQDPALIARAVRGIAGRRVVKIDMIIRRFCCIKPGSKVPD